MAERYAQKIIFVDAYQLTRDIESDRPAWLASLMRDGKVTIERATMDKHLYGCAVRTPEGKMRAKVGDYIVREPDGSLRVLKASHFRSLYELEGDAG